MADNEKPVFIVGCFRSGTTLLRTILNCHPDIWIPEETGYIPIIYEKIEEYGDISNISNLRKIIKEINVQLQLAGWEQRPAVDDIIKNLDGFSYQDIIKSISLWGQRQKNVKIWGDNTPAYVNSIFLINYLFPSSKFINLVRDGRDVAASAIDLNLGGYTATRLAEEWNLRLFNGLLAEIRLGPQKLITVKYEDLVSNTEKCIKRICSFLGIQYVEEMKNPHLSYDSISMWRQEHHRNLINSINTKSINSYKFKFTPKQIKDMERIMGNALFYYNYSIQNQHTTYQDSVKIYQNLLLNYLLYLKKQVGTRGLINFLLNKLKRIIALIAKMLYYK